MLIRIPYILTFLLLGLSFISFSQSSDSTKSKIPSFYNWTDVYLNRFNYKLAPSLTLDPKQLNTRVLFNPQFSNFSITEKVSSEIDVKTPEALTFNEYSSIQNTMLRKSIIRDIEKAQDGYTDFSGKRIRPLLETSKIFDKIFGDKLPEFMPNGFIQVMAAHHRRRTDDPEPLYNMDRSYFDFDQQIAINFSNLFNQQGGQGAGMGSQMPSTSSLPTDIPNNGRIQDLNNIMRKPNEIKEKVNILGNFDTKSAFAFDNRMKINFKNEPEDILQAVELGNISFPNRSQLIPGVQNLLGAKVGLKFGKLDIIGVVAQQNSKTKSIVLNGGNQSRNFEIRADNYEENRHFFLAHFFREQYEASLRSLPIITSGVLITRVEAYVTNRTYSVETNRNILAVNDLAEAKPFNTENVIPIPPQGSNLPNNIADNGVNNLKEKIIEKIPRNIDQISGSVSGIGLTMGQDYELLRGAKKLLEGDFDLNQELGYISLRTPLRNDEVLAVSFEYTYRGKRFRVGELTEDYVNRSESDAIILKLLKSSNIRNNLKNPQWDLMMKNVYNLGQGQLKQDGFQMRVIYKDDATGMDVPFLADVPGLQSTPLLSLLNLDRLNYNNEIIGNQNDNLGDGNFDFIEGVTINSRYGRIIFPVLEPFGSHLENKLQDKDAQFARKYVFDDLYNKTLTDAQQNTLKNKFFLSGQFILGGADIPLPLGASATSVRVYAGGTELKQGVDYMVDPQMGTVRLTNQSLANSGRTIRVDYEEADMFQSQIRRMFGLRMDYTVSRNLRIGGTLQDLRENTPGFTTRTSIGNEPVNNTIWGLDLNYKKNGIGLTKFLDALPGIQTKEPSSVMINAEFAQLIPGVNTKRVNNSSMIDDFEYARNINDLSRQPTKWRLGSTPPEFQTENGTFESAITNKTYEHHFRRAKMSVYSVDMTTYFSGQAGGGGVIPPQLGTEARSNPFTANFNIQDILVGRSMPTFAEQVPTSILDIAYFPKEPGMYNYNTNLNSQGELAGDPKKNFGAVTRGITFDADFDNSNVEYLEFWMMNPFADVLPVTNGERNENGGILKIQIGDVSEDVVPDGRYNFENGIKPDSLGGKGATRPFVNTTWGKAPDVQFMVDAFENDASIRKVQDVGFDGLSNDEEKTYTNPNDPTSTGIKGFLDVIKGKVNGTAFENINRDPSKDDFRHFLDPAFDNGSTFLERYKDYLGVENNSPYNTEGSKATVVYANSNLIDKEDVNQDNTINELEDFFEYEIKLRPDSKRGLENNGFIVDSVQVSQNSDKSSTWYLLRIPIKSYTKKFPASKEDVFKSVRFMRLVTTEFEQPVVLRFATLQLVSNQYRKYTNKIYSKPDPTEQDYYDTPLDSLETSRTKFNSTTVSIEENGCPPGSGENCKGTKSYPYAVPPGFVRDVNFAHQARMEFNEQAISLDVEKLQPKDSRGVFKNTQLDLNMYKRIKMFVHAHSETANSSDSLGMFIRIGTDLKNNYYEIEIPKLTLTSKGEISPTLIWPSENEIDIPLDELRSLKLKRNEEARTPTTFKQIFTEPKSIEGTASGTEAPVPPREYKISVKGNPDLSKIMTIMIGVRNNHTEERSYTIWANELRAFGFDAQDKGSAGLLSVDMKLADLGTLMLAGNFRNFGFGSVQDRISSRAKEDSYSYGGVLNLALDKFLPMKWGFNIPFSVNYDRQVSTPGFNPLDPDIRLDRALESGNLSMYQENLTRDLVSNMSTTSGFNFMNVHKVKSATNTKSNFYDFENFTFSYAQNRIYRSNILMAKNDQSFTSAGITYQFSPKGWNFEPFKKSTKLDSSGFKFLKLFKLNPIPTIISYKGYREQVMYRTIFRDQNLNSMGEMNQNLIRYFHGNRYYDLSWNLTQNITVTYSAHMLAILDDMNNLTPTNLQEQNFFFRKGVRFPDLGRAKNYNQKIRAAWKIPLQEIYILDWINASATYDNRFIFKGVAFNQLDDKGKEYGNIIENGRDFGVDGRVDFVKLYNKFGYLRRANKDAAPKRRYTRAPGDELDMIEEGGKLAKMITRLLMTARGVNARFALTESTIIPGFTEIPKYFGVNNTTASTLLPFVLGRQNPDKTIEKIRDKGWLSESIQQYNPIIQQRGYKFEYSTNLEPFKGFRMIIRGNIERNNDLSYVYQPNSAGEFEKFSPVRGGSFKMSFWSFKTSFKKVDGAAISGYAYEPFTNLVENRDKVMGILAGKNSADFVIKDGEKLLLDKNSQDVLIPAFFAAYTGRDVNDLFTKKKFTRKGSNTFNPFLGFPMPNWQVNYQGLEKVEGFKALFTSITLSHSFVSSYSVGNFTSSLLFDERAMDMLSFRKPLGKGYNIVTADMYNRENINALTNLLDPIYIMSSIVMEEKFAPFLGVNFTTKGNFTGNFAWNKDRMAMMNLSNAQVSETHGNDFIFGFGMKRNNLVLPFKGADGNQIILKNDLIFRIDFSFRDLKVLQRKLDGDAVMRNGARSIQARPNVQYTFSKRISMTMYWEKQINTPYVSQTWYTNNASFGVTARFNLTD